MAEAAIKRLSQAAKDLNIGMQVIVDFLASIGYFIENKPITKLTQDQITLLDLEFNKLDNDAQESLTISINKKHAATFARLEYIRGKKGQPSTFYKYFGTSDYHFESLEKNYLFLSPSSYFNDPFDCSTDLIDFSSSPKKFNNASVERFKERLNSIGICCFSRINDSILMWSHYANSHKGFCIEFQTDYNDPTDIHPLDVCYQEGFVKLNFHRNIDDAIANMIFTKSIHWQYEEELRILDNNLTDIEKRKKVFNDKKVKSIFLGVNCEDRTITKVKQLVKEKYTSAKIYQGYKNLDSFSISFKEVTI